MNVSRWLPLLKKKKFQSSKIKVKLGKKIPSIKIKSTLKSIALGKT